MADAVEAACVVMTIEAPGEKPVITSIPLTFIVCDCAGTAPTTMPDAIPVSDRAIILKMSFPPPVVNRSDPAPQVTVSTADPPTTVSPAAPVVVEMIV